MLPFARLPPALSPVDCPSSVRRSFYGMACTVPRACHGLRFRMLLARPAFAQITTGTVTGTVKDDQGWRFRVPASRSVSEARATRMAPVFTASTGEFVIPNVEAGTHARDRLEGFRPVRRTGSSWPAATAWSRRAPAHHRRRQRDRHGDRGDPAGAESKRGTLVLDFDRGRSGDPRSTDATTTTWPRCARVVAGTVNGLRVNRTPCRSTASPRSIPATTATV